MLLAVLKDVLGGSVFQECIRNIYLLKVELCFIIPGHWALTQGTVRVGVYTKSDVRAGDCCTIEKRIYI